MEKQSVRFIIATILAGVFAIAAPAIAENSDELEIDGSIRVGAQWLDVDGDRAKFNEYRHVGEGFGVVAEEVMLRGYKGAYFFFVEGLDLDRSGDRSLVAESGRYARYRINFGWDETSHHFANDVPFLGTLQGGDYWAIPDIVQSTLQPDFPLGFETAPPSSWNRPTANGVANLLDLLDNANRLDLALVRQTATADLSFTAFENFDILADYLHRAQNGFRPMSTGLYQRDSDGAYLVGGVGENFMLYGMEFPEPIDYDTNEVGAGFHYQGESWNVNLRYQYVSFENNNDTVTWDNPFVLAGTDGLQYGTSLNRLDLLPSSTSNTVSATGGIWDLPLDSRFTMTASWGRITQDNDFPAYTVNDVLTVLGGPNDGALAAPLALPADDLDGGVDTFLINAVLSSRPIDPLSVDIKLNYYSYNDRSNRISWVDGWARIGETVWSKPAEAGVINRTPDWSRLRPSVNVKYRLNKMLTLLGDYVFEGYNRNYDRNADTNENIAGVGFKLDPISWVTLRANYHYANRKIDGEYRPAPAEQFYEWEELRMFDQADRKRHSLSAYLNLNPTDRLTLGASFDYRHDRYDEEFYGLQARDGYMLGFDASYAISDRVSLFAYYTRDDYDSETLTRSKTSFSGGGTFDDPENDWLTEINDADNTVGAAFSFDAIPQRLSFEIGGAYSFGNSAFDTSNTDYVAGITTSSATGFPWEETEIKTTQVTADLEYSFTENLSTSLRYLYERYNLDDAFTDTVTPYLNEPDNQGNRLDYFLFLDANYSDYHAHLLTWTVSYEF